MKGLRRTVVCALLLSLSLLPVLPAAQAPRASREQELAALRAEIGRLEGRLSAARQRSRGLRDELAAANLELRLQEVRLAESLAARDLAVRRVEASEREVERLGAVVEETRRELGQRLAALYRLGRHGYLRLFLSLDPRRPLLPSLRLMRYLARRDRLAFDRHRAVRERLGQERDHLLAERAEREQWTAREAARRRELFAVRERRAGLLARVEKEEESLAARARSLEEREQKLAALLDLLYGRNADALAGTPIQQFRGVLDWPAEGRVALGFGPRLDPRYRTRVPHNGIDLATSPAGEVRAVFPGRVIFAAPFQGYGNTAVIHHAGRVFTLYAGLSELRVAPQNVVSLGDVVGLASDRLYFEVRVENRPEDPLSWLRGAQ